MTSRNNQIMIHCSNPDCGLSVMEYDSTTYDNNELRSIVTCKLCGWELKE